MLPLIWIYVRIRTSLDGSRRHRQNLSLIEFPPPPTRLFFSLSPYLVRRKFRSEFVVRRIEEWNRDLFFFFEGDETFSSIELL